jgi:hypothetical protein
MILEKIAGSASPINYYYPRRPTLASSSALNNVLKNVFPSSSVESIIEEKAVKSSLGTHEDAKKPSWKAKREKKLKVNNYHNPLGGCLSEPNLMPTNSEIARTNDKPSLILLEKSDFEEEPLSGESKFIPTSNIFGGGRGNEDIVMANKIPIEFTKNIKRMSKFPHPKVQGSKLFNIANPSSSNLHKNHHLPILKCFKSPASETNSPKAEDQKLILVKSIHSMSNDELLVIKNGRVNSLSSCCDPTREELEEKNKKILEKHYHRLSNCPLTIDKNIRVLQPKSPETLCPELKVVNRAGRHYIAKKSNASQLNS